VAGATAGSPLACGTLASTLDRSDGDGTVMEVILDCSNLTVVGGYIGNVIGSEQSYSFVVTLIADGPFMVALAADAAGKWERTRRSTARRALPRPRS
jgi:hypothetical protein